MERLVKILLLRRAGVDGLSRGIFFVLKMAQVAIHEAKKVLRRELKKRVAAMTDEVKLKESTSIVNKVSVIMMSKRAQGRRSFNVILIRY